MTDLERRWNELFESYEPQIRRENLNIATLMTRFFPSFSNVGRRKPRGDTMANKAQHHYDENYQKDYQPSYDGADNQSRWIWGILAGVVVLALVAWSMMSGGSSTNSTAPTASTTTEQSAAPKAIPAAPSNDATGATPAAPSNDATGAAPAAPAQPAAPAKPATSQ
jgi:hypothetical protein